MAWCSCSAVDASHIASKACLCMHKIRRVSLKSRNEDSLESKSPYLDRLVRMMSSQLKHWRIAIPGLPVTRLLGWMACRRLHFSVMWKTSLPSAQVGGISGVRSGWVGNKRDDCTA